MSKMLIDRAVVEQALEALEGMATALREEDVLGCDIELLLDATTNLRAALAEPVQEPQGCAHCEHPLYAGTRETLRLVDELALCAELKREYQEQFAQAAVQRDALLEALRELLADAEFLGWDTAKARAAIKAVEENT